MIQIVNKFNNQVIKIDERDEKSIQKVAAAIGCSMQQLTTAIENIIFNVSAMRHSEIVRSELERLSKAIQNIKESLSTYKDSLQKRVYCIYRSKLHVLDRHYLSPHPRHTIRIRSNI